MASRHEFERRIAQSWPPQHWCDLTVLVGVSGGADSVALLRGLLHLQQHGPGGQGRLVVVHFNHGLRGAESDEDARFVQALSRRWGLPCETGGPDQPLRGGRDGLEATARRQRYAFFRAVADRCGARYLATGHTADDQAETVLHRILRGTGLRGLAGIPATRALSELTTIVRPLLAQRRHDVRDYLTAIDQPFRDDSSNQSTELTRNRLRHQLIPQLGRHYNPHVTQALLRLARQAAQANELLAGLVTRLSDRCVTERATGAVELDSRQLADQPPFLVCQLLIDVWDRQRWPLQDMSEIRWRELAELVRQPEADARQLILPGAIRASRQGPVTVLQQLGGRER